MEKLGLCQNSALASRVFARGALQDAREKDEIAARRGRACARRVDTRPVHDAAREAMLERRERRLADDEPHALRGEHSRTVVMTKFTLQGKRAPILTLSWHMEDVFDTCGPLGSAHFQDHFDVQTSTVTSFGVSTRRRRRIGGRFRVVRVGARTGRVARRLGTRSGPKVPANYRRSPVLPPLLRWYFRRYFGSTGEVPAPWNWG